MLQLATDRLEAIQQDTGRGSIHQTVKQTQRGKTAHNFRQVILVPS
jgi:hypothetical protein